MLFFHQESLYSVMRHKSSAPFHLNLYICFRQKEPIKVQIFRHSTAHMKIYQIHDVIFQAMNQFPLSFALPFSVVKHSSSEMF